jgi:nucleoside-diphosphate-sugar epimerase
MAEILVTGSAGFTGSHIVELPLEEDIEKKVPCFKESEQWS